MRKVCKKCGIEKDFDDFWNYSRRKDGKHRFCKKCQAKENSESQIKNHGSKYAYYSQWRKKQVGDGNTKIIYTKKKHSAKIAGNEFNISFEEFNMWYKSTEKKCVYCGINSEDIERFHHLMAGANGAALTLDRVDNNKGYITGNIVFACPRCNLIKSNFFTYDEMKEIGNKYVKQKWV